MTSGFWLSSVLDAGKLIKLTNGRRQGVAQQIPDALGGGSAVWTPP